MPYLHGSKNKSPRVAAQHAPETTAAFVEWLLHSSDWTVRDERDNTRRPVRVDDICILFRKTVSYDEDLTQRYVRALEARNIEHVLVGSKSFHRREEIGTIRAALRAVEWPDDELSVYAVLRGALFFVSDADLFKLSRTARAVHSVFQAARGSSIPDVRAHCHGARSSEETPPRPQLSFPRPRRYAGFSMPPAPISA